MFTSLRSSAARTASARPAAPRQPRASRISLVACSWRRSGRPVAATKSPRLCRHDPEPGRHEREAGRVSAAACCPAVAPLAVKANSGLPSGPRMIYNIKHERPDIVVEPRTGSPGTSPVPSASTVVYRDSLPGRRRSSCSGRKHRCRDRPGDRASAHTVRETELLPDHDDFKRVLCRG
jgi:hypothetical protein